MLNFFIFVMLLLCSSCSVLDSDLQETITKLFNSVQKKQVQETTTFRKFPPRFEKYEGLYESDIHLNFVGNEIETELRRKFLFFDNNMFVTNFIVIALLEANELGTIQLERKSVEKAVKAILKFKDKTYHQDSPIYRFWPQYLENNTYTCYPINLVKVLDEFKSFDDFANFMCDILVLIPECKTKLKKVEKEIAALTKAFHIPPDTDDSSVNLALGRYLEMNEKFVGSDLVNLWEKENQNTEVLFRELLKFAYSPFSNNNETSLIDQRTYFVVHEYLENYQNTMNNEEEKKNLKLPATWLMNTSLILKRFPQEAMPFNVNNLDSNVLINFIFGTVNYFLKEKTEKLNSEVHEQILKMILDTSKFLNWMVDTKRIYNRRDIALTYYPSIFDFYFLVTRTSFTLNNAQKEFPDPIFNEIKDEFDVISKNCIEHINSTKKENDDGYYWDDFLGNYEGKIRGEDRLFSSSMALNSLLDYFTKKDENCKLKWDTERITDDWKNIIEKSCEYLKTNVDKLNSLLFNAFFSGSGKGFKTIPFWYPGNDYHYFNGSRLNVPPEDPSKINERLVMGMNGVPSKEVYEEYLKLKWFGLEVPIDFQGYEEMFPFWSSSGLTQSLCLLGLSKYKTVRECEY